MATGESLYRALDLVEQKSIDFAEWYTLQPVLRSMVVMLPLIGGSIDTALSSASGMALETRLTLWLEEIEQQFQHLSGKVDNLADALSYNPDDARQLLGQAVLHANDLRAKVVFPNANPIDARVLAECCQCAIEQDSSDLETAVLAARTGLCGLTSSDIGLSLRLLAEYRLIKPITDYRRSAITHFSLTSQGFNQYAWGMIDRYPLVVQRVAEAINQLVDVDIVDVPCPSDVSSRYLAVVVGESEVLTRHAVLWLSEQSYLKTYAVLGTGESISILTVSPTIRRFLQSVPLHSHP